MFLYFIVREGDSQLFSDADIEAAGLRYAIEGKIRVGVVNAGPNGKPGVIIAQHDQVASCRFYPDKQTWIQRVGDPNVWIGFNGTTPPHPAQLARSQQLPGKPVKLPDGRAIQIPIARRFVDTGERLQWAVALPQALRRDDEGKWVPSAVVGQYRRLWQLLCGYIDAAEEAIREADVADGSSVFFNYPEIDELAIGAIQANYRMGPDEVEICGQYDQRVRGDIIAVLRDEATREAWIKKKLEALTGLGGAFSPGPALSTTASTTDTHQHSQSSGSTASDTIVDEA